jgi:hypothetical protein
VGLRNFYRPDARATNKLGRLNARRGAESVFDLIAVEDVDDFVQRFTRQIDHLDL